MGGHCVDDYIEINTDHMHSVAAGNDLFENRESLARVRAPGEAKVTISILAYNRLEKLRRCVESVLTYTKGVDYELILIDNGSPDSRILDYLRSVSYDRKKVIRVTKGLQVAFPFTTIPLSDLGEFIVLLTDDSIVTERWLEQLLTCMQSDPKIGMVVPMTSNTSNRQCVEFPYHSYEEMHKFARKFNHSDPAKWEDRLRLITLGVLCRKATLEAIGWPLSDAGFFHDFGDDDIAFQIRRAGYRTVLAGDTWICHDHKLSAGEGKDPEEFARSLRIGRQNFRDKYFGVDAWDDVNNFLQPYLSGFPTPKLSGNARILGVDVRCGTPILDVKNWLRKWGIFQAELSAFTQNPMYWMDLKTICAGPVICDREEFLTDSFPREYFDYVVVDRPVNRYHEPEKLLRDLFALTRPGGYVVFWVKNTATVRSFLYLLGQKDVYDSEFAYNIPIEAVQTAVKHYGEICANISRVENLAPEQKEAFAALLPREFSTAQRNELMTNMQRVDQLLVVQKNK